MIRGGEVEVRRVGKDEGGGVAGKKRRKREGEVERRGGEEEGRRGEGEEVRRKAR